MNDLARRIGMDQGLLSKIERGLRPPPQIVPYVQHTAEALGFAVDSGEYKQLIETAYRERFRTSRSAAGQIISLTLAEEARAAEPRFYINAGSAKRSR